MAAHLLTTRAADANSEFKKVKEEPLSFTDYDDLGFHQRMESLLSINPAYFSIETDFNRLNTVTPLPPPYSESNHRLESSVENSVVKSEQVFASSTFLKKELSADLSLNRPNACGGFSDTEEPSICRSTIEWSSCNKDCRDSGYLKWRQPNIGVPLTLMSPVKGSGFSKSAQLLLDTIQKNRMCQKNLHSTVELIEALIEENKKLKDGVKVSTGCNLPAKKVERVSQMKDPRVQLISSHKAQRGEKQVTAVKFGPEMNRDAASYMDAMKKFHLTLPQKKWSHEASDNLRKCIIQEFERALLEKSSDLISYTEKCKRTSSDIDNMMASNKGLKLTPENIRAYLSQVSWDELASIHNQGRSGAECETRWLNWEDPLINNTKWTKTEDKELLRLVNAKNVSNWIDIAVSLGTNRTPFQCLARFQRSLNTQMVKREWDEEEDAHLSAAVKAFGDSNWEKVASVLDRRTGPQCCTRWKSSLNPVRVRVGRWTAEEDKHLKVSVKLLGAKCWDKISKFVPGRTQVQCRERWINCLDPSLKRDPWTEDEDMKLMASIKEYSHCWTKVAACIPPRTDNQCRRRWMALCPDDVLELQAVKRIRKSSSLVSNFVGRPTERPEDFKPLPPLVASPASKPNSKQPSNKRKRNSCQKTHQIDSGETM